MTGAIIAGIGATEFSKDSGRSTMQLAAEAGRAAILDAGLVPGDIDGMVTFTVDGNDELELMRNLGVGEIKWWSRTPVVASARAPRCSTPLPRSIRAWRTPCSSTAPSTSGRSTASVSRTRVRWVRRRSTGTSPSGSTRRRRCTRSGSAATCTRTARPTRTSVATRCQPVATPPPTPRHGSTSGRSRSRTTRRRAGSSSPCCGSSTAVRRATAASRSW